MVPDTWCPQEHPHSQDILQCCPAWGEAWSPPAPHGSTKPLLLLAAIKPHNEHLESIRFLLLMELY